MEAQKPKNDASAQPTTTMADNVGVLREFLNNYLANAMPAMVQKAVAEAIPSHKASAPPNAPPENETVVANATNTTTPPRKTQQTPTNVLQRVSKRKNKKNAKKEKKKRKKMSPKRTPKSKEDQSIHGGL